MTGPGRSPSSPWGQATQTLTLENPSPQPFHNARPSPTNGMHSVSNASDKPSPNYFGIAVGHSHNSPNSNPGFHTQKNWSSFQPAQSLPSPTKLQLYSQESMSEGLVNLLRTESDLDKDRRESLGYSSNGNQSPEKLNVASWSHGFSGPLSSPNRKSSLASVPEASPPSRWISADRSAELLRSSPRGILLLDVRPFAHFSKGNISGSLNLCIPTTLLKRRSFDTQKLENTFTSDHDKRHFAQWKECKAIIVYDSATTDPKDAVPLSNVINKFQLEGWTGEGMILQGGFKDFSSHFPDLLHRPKLQPANVPTKKRSPMSIDLPSIAPVVGGCALPESSSAVNPFFSNIRQNMDLLGGVGQIPLRLPQGLTERKRKRLPSWIQNASETKDQGRLVSETFLDLEKEELQRMKQALSYDGPSADTGGASKKYRVAGIEKGTKNRYNDIYPFEHSRVRLEGVRLGDCDYVNANHVRAEFTNRQYIATQAPVPDTFNDFWRVVWEQDVRVLVSLTAEVERGQVKSHPYWKTGSYGPFQVKAYSEQSIHVESQSAAGKPSQSPDGNNENPVITVRHFSLYHSEMPFQPLRDITQLHYPYWPDFGTTSQPAHLLTLIEQCNKAVRASSNSGFSSQDAEPKGQRPVLVHCSAGCGRTGTFCTVDSVLDMLKRQQNSNAHSSESPEWTKDYHRDLIRKAVEDFRTQRPSMVQNLSQYVLCYESVLEWLVTRMDNESS
ncbi:hypothetical protein N7478_009083 [Penicillium angulare]|uniref:uncharacterized protein n=1 Tax=Penicillium angulare TaxID=116970 RepID=UPI0025409621|nr:uncharacterized protein N7478_009083 [Penicillium angulare]KAJ5273958.1 hypothetical protein N7478_009083 [Penicillium angulare]